MKNQLKEFSISSEKCGSLNGAAKVPGDKSISHRALMLSSQAIGTSTITGLLEGEDVMATAGALRLMGVDIERKENGTWIVKGVGVGGLAEPSDVLDMGNAGTGTRLLMGLVAPYNFKSTFTGDESLRSRPMGRVIKPLEEMGVRIESREGGKLPLTVFGSSDLIPITYELPVASAQVKSCILLAGLNTDGETTVIEHEATRDHTERMLQSFGADIITTNMADGSARITIKGYPELKAQNIEVPGDPSSAAFPVVAALITEGSDITLENICINKSRIGLYTTLIEMGADIEFLNERTQAGEQVADLRVKYSKLKGIEVPAERAPSMIDEYPILAVAASYAKGITIMNGVHELRVKESDRIAAMEQGLKSCGVTCESGDDWMKVTGSVVKGGTIIKTFLDHRIAMSFLVLGMSAQNAVIIDDYRMINTSFPGFIELMNKFGARYG